MAGSMAAGVVAGAGFGLGLALIAYGIRPPRPALAALLDSLNRPAQGPALTRKERVQAVLSGPSARAGLPGARARADLAVLGVDPAEHLAEQAALVLLGGLGVPAAAMVLGFGGQTPLWAAAAGAGTAWWYAGAALHSRAESARDALRHTLSIMLNLLSISLARGAGIEQAISEATAVCSGPAADRLSAAIASARVLRRPPWQPLGELGEATAVTELQELAASMTLAGTDGARIRASLAARAAAIRTAATARAHAAAEKATSRMTVPLLALGFAYLIFLLYPALASLQLSP